MLIGLHAGNMILLLLAGIMLDLLLGEVPRWHPLVGFGRCANYLEICLNRGKYRFAKGMLAWMLVVLPFVAMACLLAGSIAIGLPIHVVLLYFCIGLRSLHDHSAPIAQALQQGDLELARQLTARIVSRDTQQASAADLAKATTESLLENGNDAVFGTVFWFVLAGGPGALLFRLANTLDAMWGYKTSRFLSFGCTAARIDDVLNWIPARLTALSYVLLGATLSDKQRAWYCWQSQAKIWPSPNAGPVMASGAGALGLALGGNATYKGVLEQRPILGSGRAAEVGDIERAWRLVANTTALWAGIVMIAGAVLLLEKWIHA